MHSRRLSRLHILFIIVPPTLLLISAHLASTQSKPSATNTPTQLSEFAAQSVAAPEASLRFHPAYENLSLPFAPNQEQVPSQVSFRSLDIRSSLSLAKVNALPNLWQLAKTDEQQARTSRFMGNTPAEWLTHVIPSDTGSYHAPDRNEALQYYGHRIPWAGQIILGVGKQAQFHPRVTRVFELIRPGLKLEKSTYPRWIRR